MTKPLMEVRGLKTYFDIKKGFLGRATGVVRAVDDVSFDINAGETFGLVGESGCGKTTIGRTLLRAVDPTAGTVMFRPGENREYDLASLSRHGLREVRTEMQIIYQDPYSSLSPRMTVKEIVAEPARIARTVPADEIDDRVASLLREVGLGPQHMTRYPHAFSGGQRQRIGIARSLILGPKFIVADEPVSALDVSVQAQILELLISLRKQYNLAYLFISHDLSVVRYLSDRVGVMYVGKLIEVGEKDRLFESPQHPYTEALLTAIPSLDPAQRDKGAILGGEVADASNPPSGCYFHPRCPYARDVCSVERPRLRNVAGEGEQEHLVACHFSEELDLDGVRPD
jgi:peptide/nickel transport system ATP-binding protein